MVQFKITPAAGKRLIAKALVLRTEVIDALRNNTVVVIAGTTNAYLAEELMKDMPESEGFDRSNFFRGITTPDGMDTTDTGRMPGQVNFPGDVVLVKGEWQRGKTIFDVVDDLEEGDIIFKGANAINPATGQAALLIGHPKGGTILAALQAVVGRRVRLVLPAGLEKRVCADLNELAIRVNAPGAFGSRLLPIAGEIFTELDAIESLSGARAELISGGGVCGAEGLVWLAATGTRAQEEKASEFIRGLCTEPMFEL